MWRRIFIFFALIFAITKFCCTTNKPVLPSLPEDQYWGPEQPHKVDRSIRPFKINITQDVIDDLKFRLNNARPLRKPLEGVGWTYGIDTTYLQTILQYWRTKYDWNKRQELLNKYPQYKTNIQGLDIHFIRVRPTVAKGRVVKVFPLLLVHGWPGSIVEFQKIIPMLTTPRPDEDFVFEVIAPSLPGYGFSDAAVRPGLGTGEMAVIFKNLMKRLGFDKFYTQGGDWGSMITANLAVLYPESVYGTHLNMCVDNGSRATFWSLLGSFLPFLIVSDEHWSRMYPLSHHWSRILEEGGYFHIQATKPDTVGAGLSDSPTGLAAYIIEKFSTWTNPDNRFSQDGKLLEKFTLDELLDNLMVYWVTNSITTSQRLYAENFSARERGLKLDTYPLQTKVGCAIFPYELIYQPKAILHHRYPHLIHFNHLPRGGHFAAFEEPQLLADDIWNFVKLVEKSNEPEKKTTKSDL